MKKLFFFLFILAAACAVAQKSFSKKSLVISLDANFGVYNTAAQDSTDRASGITHEDKGAPYGFSLGAEYGVLDWLGVGLRGQLCTYLTSRDSVSGARPQAKAKDIALTVNAHPVRTKRFDLATGADLGYSGFRFATNDSKGSLAKGGGLTWDIHIQPRLYFSPRFGMYLNISYIGYTYNKLKLSDNDRTYTDHIRITASGMNVGIGFQYRLGGAQ